MTGAGGPCINCGEVGTYGWGGRPGGGRPGYGCGAVAGNDIGAAPYGGGAMLAIGGACIIGGARPICCVGTGYPYGTAGVA